MKKKKLDYDISLPIDQHDYPKFPPFKNIYSRQVFLGSTEHKRKYADLWLYYSKKTNECGFVWIYGKRDFNWSFIRFPSCFRHDHLGRPEIREAIARVIEWELFTTTQLATLIRSIL